MAEHFQLHITCQGKQKVYEAQLLQLGYLHKIQVDMEGATILFEPDEESNYRALVGEEQVQKSKAISIELLQSVAQQLQTLREAGA
jgi:hypothetical protein